MSSKGVSLITGAAQGIGRAIALRLADDGFDIAINDIPSKKEALDELQGEIRGKGRKTHVILADVTIEEEVKNMIASVVKELGGLDVMVANAGIVLYAPFLATSTEDWDRLFSVNVRSVMFSYKYAAEQMVAQGRGGRIIGASSVSGKQGGAMTSAYCATKFAVRGLTQAVAQELGKHGITVNAYAPGAIYTEMLQSMDDANAALTGVAGSFLQGLENRSAVGYNGTPLEVASLVSYLASKEAHFITGQNMSVNGGIFCD